MGLASSKQQGGAARGAEIEPGPELKYRPAPGGV